MHSAAAVGCSDSVELLIGARASVDARLEVRGKAHLTQSDEMCSKTALYLAAEKGHVGALSSLLEARADPCALAIATTAEGVSRTSALWAARRGSHAAAAELLVSVGAVEGAESIPTGVEDDACVVFD